MQQVGATIRSLLAGDTVSYWLGPDGQNYEVNVQLAKDNRRMASDLGNLAAGDGCRANCSVERCGDAVVDPRENCDDGNAVAGDGCSSLCLTEVSGCGDGTLDTGEACDDGNAVGGDGCRANCSVEVCGDGLLDGEEVELVVPGDERLAQSEVGVLRACQIDRGDAPQRVRHPTRADLEPVMTAGPDGSAERHRLWPHRHGTDGMFPAVFRRRSTVGG